MSTFDQTIRVISLISGVLLLGGDLFAMFWVYGRPQRDGSDPGCLMAILGVLAGIVAVALILAGVAGPEAAVRWLVG